MRLSDAMLGRLPASVSRPGYDRAVMATGIVHLGLGAFHRAHQAVLTDAVLRAGDLRWGILGVSLRSAGTRDALLPQDGLYTLNVQGEADTYRVIGAVRGVLVAPEDPEALIGAMTRPDVRIVSLTVSEKAYCLDPATGHLDDAHPDIRHDVLHPDAPRTALGLLAAAIARRRASGVPAFTVLCCDNLARNGATLHRALVRLVALSRPGMGAFVEDEVACPDTMVDRIVPATVDADRVRVAAALGLEDAWPVVAEPFLQWVIEDRFPAGRPDWESHGATMVAAVAPFEAMKLRLLNASHSALAYLGLLAGYGTVAEAIRDPGIAGFVQGLMDDATATLALPAGADAGDYQRALLVRFGNPALDHHLAQIAMDGSQKLPSRLLGTVRDRLARGLPIERHARAVAAWMQYVATTPVLQDPLAAGLSTAVAGGGPMALLDLPAVFGADLVGCMAFRTAVADGLAELTGWTRGREVRRSPGKP